MAILKGFPPSNTISPSVRITEKDLSFIAPEQSFHRAGLVGFASKGPINIPTVVQSQRQLNTVFGHPHPEQGDPFLVYAAQQYLLVANELYVVRVADTDEVSWERARVSSINLPSAGGQVLMVSSKAGPYNLDKDMYFRWRLNKVLASKTLVALSDANHPDPIVQENGYSAAQLANDLNMQLDPAVDGIEFFSTTESTTNVDAEIINTYETTDTVTYQLANENVVAGTVTGSVVVSGAVVQTFKVNEQGVFAFKTISTGSVKASSGTVNLEDGTVTISYTGNLPENSSSSNSSVSNGLSVSYRYLSEFAVSRIGVRTTFSFGPKASLELVSVADALYGPTADEEGGNPFGSSNVHLGPTGLGSGMMPAQFTGSVAGTFDFTTLGEYDLQVVLDGTDNVLIDNINQVLDLSQFANNNAVTVEESSR